MGPEGDAAQVAELRTRDERIETLQRQLDSARVREDELTSIPFAMRGSSAISGPRSPPWSRIWRSRPTALPS